jgi:hypothetical protein
MKRQQQHSYPPTPSSHSRAMLILTVAIVGVVFCGMISQIAPRPQPQVLPIGHPQIPADVTPQFQASAAG